MKMLARAAIGLSALLACLTPAPAAAQHATTSVAPAGYAPEMVTIAVPARSIAATGSVTSTAVTMTSDTTVNGAPTFASGVATIPFKPQLGYPVRLLLKGGATLSASLGTSVDGCATVNTLTAGGSPISYSGSINEFVDVPATSDALISYCLVLAVTTGTETFAVRN